MRSNQEGGIQEGVHEVRSTSFPVVQTLGAGLTLTANMPNRLMLDAGGTARTILLPTESSRLWFDITNLSDGDEALTVKEDSNTTTIGVIGMGERAFFLCDGTTWRCHVLGAGGISGGGMGGGATRAVVPTADGLTTGLILPSDHFVVATSANADHILTLPTAAEATRRRELWIWVVASTNCELRTPAASNQTINGVDSDGSQEALLTHSQLYIVRQHLATGWLLQAFTALGAVATAIVPD